jgi:hypothetical protein
VRKDETGLGSCLTDVFDTLDVKLFCPSTRDLVTKGISCLSTEESSYILLCYNLYSLICT